MGNPELVPLNGLVGSCGRIVGNPEIIGLLLSNRLSIDIVRDFCSREFENNRLRRRNESVHCGMGYAECLNSVRIGPPQFNFLLHEELRLIPQPSEFTISKGKPRPTSVCLVSRRFSGNLILRRSTACPSSPPTLRARSTARGPERRAGLPIRLPRLR
jgi:hypothetical protein